MQPKVLFIATVDYHFSGFHIPTFRLFKEQGWEVHVAANGNSSLPFCDQKYILPITRSPFSKVNFLAYRKLKRILSQNLYDIVHCHTPVGGVIGRLAARSFRKNATRVFYTAHGFHFYKGANPASWLLYYPIERWLAKITDTLITITQEDYNLVMRHKFRAGNLAYVPGVGVDIELFCPMDSDQRQNKRKQAGFSPEDRLLVYTAEFNQNKNQALLIEVLDNLSRYSSLASIHLLLAGEGPLKKACQQLAINLGLSERVHFLGYRDDLPDLLPLCDISVASSLREGLPVNIMEAMACSLPVVAIDNRGHRELVLNGKTGWIVSTTEEMAAKINQILESPTLADEFGRAGRIRIKAGFTKQHVQNCLAVLYFS